LDGVEAAGQGGIEDVGVGSGELRRVFVNEATPVIGLDAGGLVVVHHLIPAPP
jgi:hypothetical protein